MSNPIRVPSGMTTPKRTGHGWASQVVLPLDEAGFFGRECPQTGCRAYFKLHVDEYAEARAKRLLSCPGCGYRGDDEGFLTSEQVRRVRAGAEQLAQGAAEAAVNEIFGRFNQSSPGSGVSVRFTPGPPRHPRPLPTYIERQAIRTYACPTGGHRAVVYDLLAVCPYCGPDTPPQAVFDDNLNAMRKLLEVVERLPPEHRTEIEAAGGATALTERALGGAVAALQNFAKQTHARASKPAPTGNPWQNIDRISKAWQSSFAADPRALLSDEDVATLRLGFERRHLLDHNGGVADRRYVEDSGDSVGLGRRIHFDAPFVSRFMDSATRLVDAMGASAR